MCRWWVAIPMVRYRELEVLIPQINERGIHTQLVTERIPCYPSGVEEHFAAEYCGLD